MIQREQSNPASLAVGRLPLPVLALALAACASERVSTGAAGVAETICVEPRPEVCTMDYRPVCGRLVSEDRRTYSNACGACADPEVVAYTADACE